MNMLHPLSRSRIAVRQLLLLQFIQALLAASLALLWAGPEAFLAAFYGGITALFGGGLLGRRVLRALQRPAGGDVAALAIGFVERLLAVLLCFACGLLYLDLSPGALLFGFGMGQLAHPLSAAILVRWPGGFLRPMTRMVSHEQ